jgi:hypothetical protein
VFILVSFVSLWRLRPSPAIRPEVGQCPLDRCAARCTVFPPSYHWCAACSPWALAGPPKHGVFPAFADAMVFAPDGRTLLIGHADGAILVWDVAGAVHRAGGPPR